MVDPYRKGAEPGREGSFAYALRLDRKLPRRGAGNGRTKGAYAQREVAINGPRMPHVIDKAEAAVRVAAECIGFEAWKETCRR